MASAFLVFTCFSGGCSWTTYNKVRVYTGKLCVSFLCFGTGISSIYFRYQGSVCWVVVWGQFVRKKISKDIHTLVFLSFRTDRTEQTVYTKIRLLYIVCHSICILWPHFSMVRSSCSKFRVITKNSWCPNF